MSQVESQGIFSQKVCTNPALRNLVRGLSLVAFQPWNCNHTTPVKKEFLEISRRAIFPKILTHMMELELENGEIFHVTLMKGDPTEDTLLAVLKIT